MSSRFAIGVATGLVAFLAIVMLRLTRPAPAAHADATTETISTREVSGSASPGASAEPPASSTPRDPVALTNPKQRSETALMAQLRDSLDKGTPQATLDIARELERTYPNGVQAEERSLYAIDALIALDRIPEMRNEARRHLANWPGSPLSARVEARTGVHPPPRPLQ